MIRALEWTPDSEHGDKLLSAGDYGVAIASPDTVARRRVLPWQAFWRGFRIGGPKGFRTCDEAKRRCEEHAFANPPPAARAQC